MSSISPLAWFLGAFLVTSYVLLLWLALERYELARWARGDRP